MKRRMLAVVAVFMILSLACSATSGRKRPGPTPEPDSPQSTTAAPAATSTPSREQDEGDEGVFEAQQGALNELTSYRSTLVWRLDKADGTVEESTIHQEATREPKAQRFLVESADGAFEIILIGQTTYMRFGDTWMTSSSDDSDEADDFGDFMVTQDDLVNNVQGSDYKYLGRETVNGLQTKHYRAAYTDAWTGMMNTEESDITDGTVDVWIANERDLPKFVVRFVMELKGTFDGVEGTATVTQDIKDVNTPFTIEAPQGVGGSLPAGIAVYPNATGVSSFGTMTLFQAPDDPKTVADFYRGQFEAAGWELSEDTSMDTMVIQTYKKGDESMNLMITTEEGKEGCSVMMTWEKPEG